MKKSQKSMAVAFAMILGCLPKNSLAAPKNNSLANEDNSLASGKPESVGGAEQRSKKMSNSTKIALGLITGEVTWETLGQILPELWTPGKKAFKMFSKKKTLKKKNKKNKKIKTVDELREAIRDFARTKKLNTNDEEIKAYKKMLAPVYKKYDDCKEDLFYYYHDKQEMEREGFKVVSSVYGPWMQGNGTKDDYCVFMLKPGVDDVQIRDFLNEIPQWKILCGAAAELKQEIVIGFGLHEDEYGPGYDKRLRGYISIGLKSDIEGNISNFTNGNFSIFDFTFYDKGKGINNLNELNNLK